MLIQVPSGLCGFRMNISASETCSPRMALARGSWSGG